MASLTSDQIKAMPIVDGPSPLCPTHNTDVPMQDTTQYWIDPDTGIGYDIEKQDGRWVRYKNGMVDKKLAKRQPVWRVVRWLPGDCGSAKMDVMQMADAMQPGDALLLDAHEINRSFPFGWPSMYGCLEDAVMSCLIGSGWGRYRIEVDYWSQNRLWVKLSCHESGDKIMYVDPDRRHLFKKMPDGSYESLESPKNKPRTT